MQTVIWHPQAKEVISSFPEEVKGKLGYLIYRLQLGESLKMPQSRAMSSVSKGVKELRVQGRDGIYRSFYFIMEKGKIVVFHAFKKKTQKTSAGDIEQGKKNLNEVLSLI